MKRDLWSVHHVFHLIFFPTHGKNIADCMLHLLKNIHSFLSYDAVVNNLFAFVVGGQS